MKQTTKINETKEETKDATKEKEATNALASKTIQIVMNQTTYTEQEAREKLAHHGNDIYKTLREFMSIPEPSPKKMASLNQCIYKEIRNNLGIVDINYEEKE
jgi:hypothetical protein